MSYNININNINNFKRYKIMHIELLSKSNKIKLDMWKSFLRKSALEPDDSVTQTILLWDDDILVATGSRDGNLLKCIAVDKSRQGEGLTATIITALRKEAFSEGINHLFLYTKPQNKAMFSDLFFYPVAQTDKVLLMEDKKDGINRFLEQFPVNNNTGKIGCIVMNCNPFTRGHLYLIETACKDCDNLYVFVVSEDKSRFSAEDRIEMVRQGTAHLSNVTVLPTGPYLISSATFPTYFLNDRENVTQIQCLLDIEIFVKFYVPKFNITTRYVGTEPISPMTNQYNMALKEFLPLHNITLKEIPRLEISGTPISASQVRALIDSKNIPAIKPLLPNTTLDYLINKDLI